MVARSIFLHFAVIAIAGIIVAGCSWAQTPAESTAQEQEPVTEPPASNADELFGAVDSQEPSPAEQPAQVADDAPVDEQPAPQAQDTPAAPADLAATAAEAKVHELTERVAALQTEVEELKATLATMQQALARVQDLDEFTRRALGAMAEDADLRGNLGQMLQGKVRLVNNTGESTVLYINGTPWTVVEGESYVLAPVATVAFMYESDSKPIFKGVQEWTENNGLFELEYQLQPGGPNERSVLTSAQ